MFELVLALKLTLKLWRLAEGEVRRGGDVRVAAEEKGWNSKTANLQFSIVALALLGEWAS